ncbi:MAG: sugar ABC transporter substrate-binding protein [Limnochordaceae bacterium]|nr:sugar ABC transporter substrate-binding protein [Limnochordaceae bacterium]
MDEAFRKLVDNFERSHPGIKVELVRIPSKYYDKLMTMIAGRTAPDVAMLAFDKVPQFVEAGALQPIDEFVAKSGYPKHDLFPVVVEGFSYKGKLYGLPRSFSPFVMFYNKKIFRERGLVASSDWTWSEFLEVAKKATTFKPGGPWGFAGNTEEDGVFYPEWLFPFIWQNGGDVVDGKRLVSRLMEPEAKEAMAFYVDLFQKHKVAPTSVQAQTYGGSDALFLSGRAAMIMESYVLVGSARSQAALEFDVVELPHQRQRASVAFPIGYVIPAATQHPQEAWEFLAYLGGPEGQKIVPELGLGVPGLMSVGQTDLFLQPGKQPEHAAVFLEQSKTAKLLPARVPKFSQWYEAWRQELSTVMSGAESLESALPRMDAAINKVLQER